MTVEHAHVVMCLHAVLAEVAAAVAARSDSRLLAFAGATDTLSVVLLRLVRIANANEVEKHEVDEANVVAHVAFLNECTFRYTVQRLAQT